MYLVDVIMKKITSRLHAVAQNAPHSVSYPVHAQHFRHLHFLQSRLGAAFVGLTALTIALAFEHHPSIYSALIVALCCAPFVGAVMVMRYVTLSRTHHIASAFYYLCAMCMTSSGDRAISATVLLFGLSSLELFNSAQRLTRAHYVMMGASALTITTAHLTYPHFITLPDHYIFAITSLALIHVIAGAWEHYHNHSAADDYAQRQLSTYQHALTAFECIYALHDHQGQVVETTSPPPQFLRGIFSIPAAERIIDHIHIGDRPAYLKALSDALHHQTSQHLSLRLNIHAPQAGVQTKPPLFRAFELHISPCTDIPFALMSCWRAITTPSHDVATGQSEIRDHVLAMMSHELRTPLNAIIGFSEILADPHIAHIDASTRVDYAGLIHQSSHHLLDVVNSILDMSKIEAGQFDLMPERFDLHELITHCSSLFALKLAAHDITVNMAFKTSTLMITADKKACKQIILNLLSNAIKFSSAHGTIRISTEQSGTSFILHIADDGIGISTEDLPSIGTPFFQAKHNFARNSEGTGLGLCVVKGLVQLHHGSLAIESALCRGTCVHISMPLDITWRHSAPHSSPKLDYLSLHRRDHTAAMHSTMVKKIA